MPEIENNIQPSSRLLRCEDVFYLSDINFPVVVIFPREMSPDDYKDFCDHLDLVKRKVFKWNKSKYELFKDSYSEAMPNQ